MFTLFPSAIEYLRRFISLYVFAALTLLLTIPFNVVTALGMVLPLVSAYSIYKHYRWWRSLKPSRLLGFLLTSSVAVGVATSSICALTIYRQLVLGPGAPPPAWAAVVSTSAILIIVLQAYFRTLALSDLDRSIDTKDEYEN